MISYSIPAEMHVSLKVFDLLGHEIATLVDAVESPGMKTVRFDASKIGSGVYYYTLHTAQYTDTKRMMVVR
jgi:hypothetical protein